MFRVRGVNNSAWWSHFGTQQPRWYTWALTRDLPRSFAQALSLNLDDAATPPVSVELAQQQHQRYVQQLKQVMPVKNLPALEEYPDCCFVEDVMVALGPRRMVITRPGHASRRGEVDSIKEFLMGLPPTAPTSGLPARDGVPRPALEIWDMRELSTTATCDGGDVLYTGRHLFVGLSSRTNREGAQVLQQALDGLDLVEDSKVITVPVPTTMGPRSSTSHSDVLHLKSVVTHLDPYHLLAPIGPVGDAVLDLMQARQRGYQVLRLPHPLDCNVVALGPQRPILVQDTPHTKTRNLLQKWADQQGQELIWVDTSELAKKDACLTCCSVLLDL